MLAGAIFGDHCSPISDTTVLSSRASGCDHVEHVRTQMPYALLVGVVCVTVGCIPAALGVSPWISLLVGGVISGGRNDGLSQSTLDRARVINVPEVDYDTMTAYGHQFMVDGAVVGSIPGLGRLSERTAAKIAVELRQAK